MTIKHEEYTGDMDYALAFCQPKWAEQPGCHKDGIHLAIVQHDPHSEPEPLSDDELAVVEGIASQHDHDHPDHLIRVVCYKRVV